MFPYFWGGEPTGGASGLTYANLFRSDLALGYDLGLLPDEVKAAIEQRKDEIYSAEDLHRVINEATLRR